MSDDGDHHDDSLDEDAPKYLKTIRSVSSAKGLSRAEQEDIAQTSILKMLEAERRTKIENKEAYGAKTAKHERYDFLTTFCGEGRRRGR